MRIEISQDIYNAIAENHGDVSAFVEMAAKDAIRKEAKTAAEPRFDVERVRAGFRKIEGMFGDASLQEVLSDRRSGLE